jgi:hypothetical protein
LQKTDGSPDESLEAGFNKGSKLRSNIAPRLHKAEANLANNCLISHFIYLTRVEMPRFTTSRRMISL